MEVIYDIDTSSSELLSLGVSCKDRKYHVRVFRYQVIRQDKKQHRNGNLRHAEPVQHVSGRA